MPNAEVRTEFERERDELRAQLKALAKLDEGSYGRCDVCERTIEAERLDAIPWAVRCIDDAR